MPLLPELSLVAPVITPMVFKTLSKAKTEEYAELFKKLDDVLARVDCKFQRPRRTVQLQPALSNKLFRRRCAQSGTF